MATEFQKITTPWWQRLFAEPVTQVRERPLEETWGYHPCVGGIEARLPDQPMGTGTLDLRSPTWAYIKDWATDRLQKAREKNDNASRDFAQTSMLRGEIKILKELINLSTPKSVKGLLEDED